MMMKVCIVGPGAVGSQIAAALVQGGAAASVLARGAHLDAIRDKGLVIVAPDREERVSVAASDDAQALGAQDIVVFTVKAPALAAAMTQARPLLGANTEVVAVMNGVPWWFMSDRVKPLLDPDGVIATTVGRVPVIGGVVYTAAHVSAPGRISLTVPRRRLTLGLASDTKSIYLETLAGILDRGGFPAKVSPSIGVDVWTKLIGNLSGNLIATVVGQPLNEAFTNPSNREAARHIIDEAKALAAAIGYPVKVDTERMVADSAGIPHRPSTLQDFEAGRAIELDALFRAPLALACHANVATPTLNDWVERLNVKIKDRTASRTSA